MCIFSIFLLEVFCEIVSIKKTVWRIGATPWELELQLTDADALYVRHFSLAAWTIFSSRSITVMIIFHSQLFVDFLRELQGENETNSPKFSLKYFQIKAFYTE